MDGNIEDMHSSLKLFGNASVNQLCQTYLEANGSFEQLSLPGTQGQISTFPIQKMKTHRHKDIRKWQGEDCEEWGRRILTKYCYQENGIYLDCLRTITGKQMMKFDLNAFSLLIGEQYGNILFKELQNMMTKQGTKKSRNLKRNDLVDDFHNSSEPDDHYSFHHSSNSGVQNSYYPSDSDILVNEGLSPTIQGNESFGEQQLYTDIWISDDELCHLKDLHSSYETNQQILEDLLASSNAFIKDDMFADLNINDFRESAGSLDNSWDIMNNLTIEELSLPSAAECSGFDPFSHENNGMQEYSAHTSSSSLTSQSIHEEGDLDLGDKTGLSTIAYIPNNEILGKVKTTRRKRDRGLKNYEFLMKLLTDERTNPSLIEWIDEERGIFRLKEPGLIAKIWSSRNPDKPELSYNNFARGLRYNYIKGTLIHIPEKQFVYGCGPQALEFLSNIKKSNDC